jgi:hypothetical protein
MNFKTATDVLTQGPTVTLARIAERFGLQLATIARARIDTANRRPPPVGWEVVIAEIAETHAQELDGRVIELRKLAEDLRRESRG